MANTQSRDPREQDRKDYQDTQTAQRQDSNRASGYSTTEAPTTYYRGGRR